MASCLYHVIQWGNRKQQVFFEEADYHAYLELLTQFCPEADIRILAYSLLPNHVHLVLVSGSLMEMRRIIGKAHRLYRRRINFRTGASGRLWQDQLSAFPLHKEHLPAAVRYIEMEPVNIHLAARAGDYPWSSAGAHLTGCNDRYAEVAPLLKMVPDWEGFLMEIENCTLARRFRGQERRAGIFNGISFSGLMSRFSRKTSSPGFLKKEKGPK